LEQKIRAIGTTDGVKNTKRRTSKKDSSGKSMSSWKFLVLSSSVDEEERNVF
jgi:hypothetical protein